MSQPSHPNRGPSLNALIRQGVKVTHLQLIAALAETGQVLGAADIVGITQPAASRLLAQLEQAVGMPIFTRRPRGVQLTEVGQILAQGAARMLSDLDLTYERITQAREGALGQVRLGAVTGPSLEWILPTVRDLRATLPEIELAIAVDTSVKLADGLLARALDFYIGRVPDGVDMRPFRFDPVGDEPISLVVRQSHPLTRCRNLTLDDCLGYDWVMQPPGGLLRQSTETYLISRGYPLPERTVGTTSTLFTLGMIRDTDAIAPVARAVAEFLSRDAGIGGRLEILDVATDLTVKPYGLVRRADDDPTPAVERVIAALWARRPGTAD